MEDMINRRSRARWAGNDIVLRAGSIGLVTETGAYKIGDGVTPWSDLPYAPGGPFPTPATPTDPLVNYVPYDKLTLLAAAQPILMAKDTITRNSDGAAISYAVAWPDGARGVYTGVASTAKPAFIESYKITHILNGYSTTYTQPAMTLNANGFVTNRPQITVAETGIVISNIGTPTLALKTRGATELVLTVGTVVGALLYEQQSKTTAAVAWGTATQVAPGDITVSGLLSGSSFQFRVRAVNADGPGNWSTPVTGTTIQPITDVQLVATPGDAVVSLEGSALGSTSLQLQRGTTGTGPWSDLGSPSTNGTILLEDTGRLNSTQYFYRLIATNPDGTVTGPVKAATPIGSFVAMTLLRSRNIVNALTGTYPIIRYREPNRKKVVIRNLTTGDPAVAGSGGKTLQINYSTQTNNQGTQPNDSSTWINVPPGSEFVDKSGNINKIYARPAPTNANTGSMQIEVYTEVNA